MVRQEFEKEISCGPKRYIWDLKKTISIYKYIYQRCIRCNLLYFSKISVEPIQLLNAQRLYRYTACPWQLLSKWGIYPTVVTGRLCICTFAGEILSFSYLFFVLSHFYKLWNNGTQREKSNQGLGVHYV